MWGSLEVGEDVPLERHCAQQGALSEVMDLLEGGQQHVLACRKDRAPGSALRQEQHMCTAASVTSLNSASCAPGV